MAKLNPSPLNLEFNLQDTFFSESSSSRDAEIANPLISGSMWEKWFQIWLETLKSELPSASSYELSLLLTDDAEIQTFNAQYRQKNQPTDVLAFAALEVEVPDTPEQYTEEPLYLGDIIISVETAWKQAKDQNHSLKQELAWLASHGFLHLLGWDHPDEASLQKMLTQQETLLSVLGLLSKR